MSRLCEIHKIIWNNSSGIRCQTAMGKEGTELTRKLIIDGNAVYEIDEECMLKNRLDDHGHSGDANKREHSRYTGKVKKNQEDDSGI